MVLEAALKRKRERIVDHSKREKVPALGKLKESANAGSSINFVLAPSGRERWLDRSN